MRKIKTFDREIRRKKRIREKINGTGKKPRISVYRSNKYIYVQAIDDEKKTTIASFSSMKTNKKTAEKKNTKQEQAKVVGKELAEALKKLKVNEAVFDRSTYRYHGRVAAVAEGLREGGIKI